MTLKPSIVAGFNILSLLICMLLAGCGGTNGTGKTIDPPRSNQVEGGEAHEEHGEGEEVLIRLTSGQLRQAGIEVGLVESRTVNEAQSAPARIVPAETGVAHVGSLVAGRIVRFLVTDGTPVKKGTPLVEVESLEIGEIKGAYLRARAAVEQARTALARQEQLQKENIGAQRSLEEARAAAHTAVADLTVAGTKLAALGITPSTLEGVTGEALSARVVIRSPIPGVVSRREVSLGEYVDPSRDIVDVVDPTSVYADAQVSPELAGKLRVGSRARIRTVDGQVSDGRVSFIAPQVDPDSRTVQVRIALSGRTTQRPESFVTAEFDVQMVGHVQRPVVPASSVDQDASGTYVYVERQAGAFERVPVSLDDVTSEVAVVRAGVAPGARIAVKGVFYLKSAQRKGELAEHEH